jgi:hypothetical protein
MGGTKKHDYTATNRCLMKSFVEIQTRIFWVTYMKLHLAVVKDICPTLEANKQSVPTFIINST